MSIRSRSHTALAPLAATLAGLVLAACQSIPDVSNWTQSTKDVTAAVNEGFQASARINGDLARRTDPELSKNPDFVDVSKRYGAVAAAIATRADDYEVLFGAVSDYSASLNAIAKAAAGSQATVDAVAGSLQTLVGSLGVTSLAGPGFELMKGVANEVIQIKAAGDFAEAVEKADPYIGEIAALLTKDLQDLERTVAQSKDEALRAALEEPRKKDLEYYRPLVLRRSVLQAKIGAALAPPPATPGAAVTTTSLIDVNDAPELAKIDQYLADADSWHAPFQAELDRALAARASAHELSVQTRRAVVAWRSAHASIASAVKERRLPDSGRLAALGVRIRDLVTDIQANQ